jgi:MFS family permease
MPVRLLLLAMIAMLVQQSFAFMATVVLPVAAPAVAHDLGLEPALIGGYSVFLYSVGFLSALGCGGFIIRYGALRMSQVSLALMGLGLTLASFGYIGTFALGAMFTGLGSAISTPASSEILARFSPPGYAPLVFSVKQTGVPAGGIIAGMLVPFLIGLDDWRLAFQVCAGMCFALAVLLQPLRAGFDDTRQPGYRITLTQVLARLKEVGVHRDRREMAILCFAYVGVQSIFGIFFVTYLVNGLGYDLTLAGQIFAGAQAVSIGARIFWGWLASRYATPRFALALFGIAMAVACAVCGLITRDWSVVAVTAVAVAYSATAISFHGVMIAEIARISPPGQVGAVTGGVLAFANAGMLAYPALFGLLLAVSGGYELGFALLAVPALVVGFALLRPAVAPAGAS